MSVGALWDPTVYHIISGQQVPQRILVQPLVNAGHQAHQGHRFHPQTDGQTEVVNEMPFAATQADSAHVQSEVDKVNSFIERIQHICQQVHDILDREIGRAHV